MGFFSKETGNNPDEVVELPVHVRATQVRRERRSLILRRKRLGTWLVYDVRFRNGEVEHHVNLNRVLMGSRYPADYWSTVHGANAIAGKDGTPGQWVDYPYGRPLND